jgi:hypothetical protein
MPAADDEPGPRAGPLPPPEPPRLPGERLLRRRAPMSGTAAASAHPGGLLVRRGLDTALALRGNAPAGALWRDPDGRWRAAPGAAAARAVCGAALDEDALEALEGRAPSFRRFAEAREWLLAALGGDQGGGGGGGDGPARRGGRRPDLSFRGFTRGADPSRAGHSRRMLDCAPGGVPAVRSVPVPEADRG